MHAPRGESRYGLRPARLPPRDQHNTLEVNEAGQHLHLSTADHLKVGCHPWLNIGSARWLRFESAPTGFASLARCEHGRERA